LGVLPTVDLLVIDVLIATGATIRATGWVGSTVGSRTKAYSQAWLENS
jgi:hypothetical protein